MIGAVGWILVLCYLSLLVELLVLRVPSEASTLQLLTRDPHEEEGSLREVLGKPTWWKAVAYALPTAIGLIAFLWPLAAVGWPEIRTWSGSLHGVRTSLAAWVGAGVAVGGRVLTFWAMARLRSFQRSGTLLDQGIFGWSRNPGLVGMYGFFLGGWLTAPNGWLALGFVVYVWNMHRKVILEECHLHRRWGPTYEAYRRRVPRYVIR